MKTKNFITFILLSAIISACSSDDLYLDTPPHGQGVTSLLRDEAEIIEIAQNAISMFSDNDTPTSRTTAERRIGNAPEILAFKNKSMSRTSGTDPLMYVVNYADNMGFAIVSANKNAPALIAVTENGHYDPENPGDNEAFNSYMDCVAQSLESLPGIPFDPNPGFPLQPITRQKVVIDTLWRMRVPNRVSVTWGQTEPEGELCPNKTSGCSNTAAAMAMSYFEYPTQMTLKHDSNKVVSFDWTAIKRHKHKTTAIYCYDNDESHTAIAQICRELGYRSKSEYKTSDTGPSTSTKLSDIENTLKGLGFTVTSHSDPKYGELGNALAGYNSILLVRGTDKATDSGHMWVCDAAKNYDIRKRYYESYGPLVIDPEPEDELKGWTLKETTIESYSYNYFNWGWNGDSNGYFTDCHYNTICGKNSYDFSKKVKYLKVSL